MCPDPNAHSHGVGVKLYTDAAVKADNDGVGYKAVVLDADGNIGGAMEIMDPTLHTPLAAEVNAIIHCIRLLQRMNISTAHVFSDSINVVKMINGEIQITSEVYHWIVQIQGLYFNHVSRHQNRRAHFLARDALAQCRNMLWLDNLPSWIVTMSNATHCKCNFPCNCLQ